MAERRLKTYGTATAEIEDQRAAAARNWYPIERRPLSTGDLEVVYEYREPGTEPAKPLW